ncbi:MAG: hypothetical protein ACOC8F_07310 [Planctomycetota bacterium]
MNLRRRQITGLASIFCMCLAGWLVLTVAGCDSDSQAEEPRPDGTVAEGEEPGAKANEWSLSEQPGSFVRDPAVSRAGGVVCFNIERYDREARRMESGGCWMLNTATGEMVDLQKALLESVELPGLLGVLARPSADGKHVVLIAVRRAHGMSQTAYLLPAAGGEARKLADGRVLTAAWSQEKLYIGGVGMKGETAAVEAYDPAGDEPTELPVRGLVMHAAPGGEYLIAACDASDPSRVVSGEELGELTLCAVSADGEVLGELGPSDEVGGAELSPDGRRIAIQRQRWHDDGPPDMLGTRISSLPDGEVVRDVKEHMPVAVLNDGSLIAVVPDEGGAGATIQRIGPDGKRTELAASAQAAVVGGNRLFYVPDGEPLRLRAVALE